MADRLVQDTTVLIIGAGPAGLAAALTLARALQPTVMVDAPASPRNVGSPAIGAVLGHDGIPPDKLRARGMRDIERYGTTAFESGTVTAIEGAAPESVTAVLEDGRRIAARAILLACGMVDLMPQIAGLSAFWGRSIINCPFCHGTEFAGRPWGVLCDRPEMLEAAEIYAEWTRDLVFFLPPGAPLPAEREATLTANGFAIERRPIRRFVGRDGALSAVEVEGGVVPREAMVVWPRQRQTHLVASLALDLADGGCVAVDAGFRTSRPGVYAAGDLLYQGHQNIATAMHMGNLAAATMVADLAKGAV